MQGNLHGVQNLHNTPVFVPHLKPGPNSLCKRGIHNTNGKCCLPYYALVIKCFERPHFQMNTRRLSMDNWSSLHDLDLGPTRMKPSNATSIK